MQGTTRRYQTYTNLQEQRSFLDHAPKKLRQRACTTHDSCKMTSKLLSVRTILVSASLHWLGHMLVFLICRIIIGSEKKSSRVDVHDNL